MAVRVPIIGFLRGGNVIAGDLPKAEQDKAQIAGLFAMLGKPYEDFRPVWSRADRDSKRVFLKVAHMPESWSLKTYDELTPQTRLELKTRVFALRDWLNKVLKDD